mgnify:FL=1
MKKKKILIIVPIIILIILFVLVILNSKSTNKKLLKDTKSLVTLQSEYEKDFKTNGYKIENPNIIIDPYKSSPLTALVLFETKNDVTPKVTVVGKDKNTTITHTFQNTTKHYLSIYGLYPDYENKVIIEYKEKGKQIKKEVTIKTDKLPDDFPLPTSVNSKKEELGTEFYFYTPSSKGYSCAYDMNGDVRWYLTHYAIWDNTRLKNGNMLVSTERLINTPYYMTGLYEIDMFGKIYKEYSLPGGYHHDYYEMPNGNLLVATDDFDNKYGTVEDYIVELDRKNGKIVNKIDLKNILKMTDGKSENWTSYDWFHNNSVWYDEKTNSITLSGRHQDAVINIDYNTKKLNWIIGDSKNWSKDYQKYFFKKVGENFEWQWSQHAAMITKEGYVFLFDNGNNKSKIKDNYVPADKSYSRGVMYKINKKNMTIEQIWEYGKERGSDFYSPYISDVDYLGKNHYIVHSGGIVKEDGKPSNQPAGLSTGNIALKSDTVELLNDKVIFELVLPTNNYRVEKMNIYNDTKLELGKAKRVGTLGKTKVTSKKYGIINNTKNIKSIAKKYNIKLTKEEDRLVFSGRFKRKNNVNIILYKNLKSNYYKVKVSKHPYTALCVDIFTEEENKNGINITKYINKEGLKGKYSIYIEIDGVIYQTKEYVKF